MIPRLNTSSSGSSRRVSTYASRRASTDDGRSSSREEAAHHAGEEQNNTAPRLNLKGLPPSEAMLARRLPRPPSADAANRAKSPRPEKEEAAARKVGRGRSTSKSPEDGCCAPRSTAVFAGSLPFPASGAGPSSMSARSLRQAADPAAVVAAAAEELFSFFARQGEEATPDEAEAGLAEAFPEEPQQPEEAAVKAPSSGGGRRTASISSSEDSGEKPAEKTRKVPRPPALDLDEVDRIINSAGLELGPGSKKETPPPRPRSEQSAGERPTTPKLPKEPGSWVGTPRSAKGPGSTPRSWASTPRNGAGTPGLSLACQAA